MLQSWTNFPLGKTFIFEELSISQNFIDLELVLVTHPQMSAVYTRGSRHHHCHVFPASSCWLSYNLSPRLPHGPPSSPAHLSRNTPFSTICWLSLTHPSLYSLSVLSTVLTSHRSEVCYRPFSITCLFFTEWSLVMAWHLPRKATSH